MKLKFPASLSVIGHSIVDWWDSWLDLVMAVVLWLLAQVTIVFGPPATFGLYYTARQLLNGESLGARGIIEGGRKYFGKSWLWALINLLALVILYANFRFYGQFGAGWAFYVQVLFVVLGFLWGITQLYALAFFMEFEEPRLLVAIRNGFFTGMASLFFSIILMLFAILIALLSALLVLPVLFGLPALIPILFIRGMYNRLETYGLREREKSPKELEREQSSRIEVPRMNEVADGEGQIEDQDRDEPDQLNPQDIPGPRG